MCAKKRYPTERHARDALLSTMIARAVRKSESARAKRKESRAYFCPHCKGWHLTSEAKRAR